MGLWWTDRYFYSNYHLIPAAKSDYSKLTDLLKIDIIFI
ncbi:hypothetical protein C7957_11710 [Halanaerobium saccharolyticum]|uniref:Uncharacterized protein n=1 Tax=Halanaerobium saccharolyticum TaxID=43595 RepID=A0A4R6RW72_9FIRM|nr:hypothetical protein C7957_11710 [Halanaerobium saccharolyticum]